MTGRPSRKIYCEAIAKTSGKQCRAKGYYTPTQNRFLCMFHRGSKSWDNKTRKYKGLYKNDRIKLDNKVKILKNLKNFKDKTDEEIREYITQERERAANTIGYRTKYYTRSITQWRSRLRNSKTKTHQLDDFIQLLRSKPKV